MILRRQHITNDGYEQLRQLLAIQQGSNGLLHRLYLGFLVVRFQGGADFILTRLCFVAGHQKGGQALVMLLLHCSDHYSPAILYGHLATLNDIVYEKISKKCNKGFTRRALSSSMPAGAESSCDRQSQGWKQVQTRYVLGIFVIRRQCWVQPALQKSLISIVRPGFRPTSYFAQAHKFMALTKCIVHALIIIRLLN